MARRGVSETRLSVRVRTAEYRLTAKGLRTRRRWIDQLVCRGRPSRPGVGVQFAREARNMRRRVRRPHPSSPAGPGTPLSFRPARRDSGVFIVGRRRHGRGRKGRNVKRGPALVSGAPATGDRRGRSLSAALGYRSGPEERSAGPAPAQTRAQEGWSGNRRREYKKRQTSRLSQALRSPRAPQR